MTSTEATMRRVTGDAVGPVGFRTELTDVIVQRALNGLYTPDQVTLPPSYAVVRDGSSVELSALLLGFARTAIALLTPASARAYAVWSAFDLCAPRPADDDYWITVTKMTDVTSKVPIVITRAMPRSSEGRSRLITLIESCCEARCCRPTNRCP
jgi:hypothetical protein